MAAASLMIERSVLRFIIGLGVPLASAVVMEQLPKTRIAQVPFAFQVEEQTLPPGTYWVKQAEHGLAVRIQNEKVADAAFECVAARRKFGRPEGARLVFENQGGRYVLSEIWFEADGRGLILQDTRANREKIRSVTFE